MHGNIKEIPFKMSFGLMRLQYKWSRTVTSIVTRKAKNRGKNPALNIWLKYMFGLGSGKGQLGYVYYLKASWMLQCILASWIDILFHSSVTFIQWDIDSCRTMIRSIRHTIQGIISQRIPSIGGQLHRIVRIQLKVSTNTLALLLCGGIPVQ